jgi:diadenosine tetraphosphate (Ap4A) HIT family hydrolase
MMNPPSTCPFCALPPERIISQTPLSLMILDGYPVSPGHTLIIPKRHVGSFFEITIEERDSLLFLLHEARQRVMDQRHPDGLNIGINDGAAAGQTVPHLHIHLIPRFIGDLPDPRGGVRWVIPEKACYWTR